MNIDAAKLAAKELKDAYKSCQLCPWQCRINRTSGHQGKCGASDKAKIASAAPHFGEEPMISGTKGSGTIFFSNCNLKCFYCQNYQISQEGLGDEISDDQLADIMLMLQSKGCHNINLVSPTHYLPNIINALIKAAELGLNIPIVYNTNGYEKIETLKILDGIVDIYLPDIKYSSNVPALKLSGISNYVEADRAAIIEMHRQVSELQLDKNGNAIKGLLVRHLVLPNDLAGTKASMGFLADISKDIHVGIMAQYKPCYKAVGDNDIGRKLTFDEYRQAVDSALDAGLTNILTQELESSDLFLPDFKRADPFK